MPGPKNFARHSPMPSEDKSWGAHRKDKPNLSDRMMGATGDAAKYAAAGSSFGPAGTIIGGTLGAVKGFMATPKGKGAETLVSGATAATTRALAAKKGPPGARPRSEGSVGVAKKGSKDAFIKKGDVITKVGSRVRKRDEDEEWE